MTPPTIHGIAPFFIVRNVPASVAFYRDKLNFEVLYQGPKEDDIFFAMVIRGGAMLMLKAVGADPQPNNSRHPWAPWDAYINLPDPDALAAEFISRGVTFSTPLQDTTDNLRGFGLKDPDGYVLFFGRPQLRTDEASPRHTHTAAHKVEAGRCVSCARSPAFNWVQNNRFLF